MTSLALGQDLTVFGSSNLDISDWHLHFSRHTFQVDNPGEGILVIKKNTPEKEIRGEFLFFNGRFVSLRQFVSGGEPIFYKDISLRSTNRLIVFLRGTPAASVSIEIRRSESPIPPPAVTFLSDPASITIGESATLSWAATFVDTCAIEPGIGTVDPTGTTTVSPTETTTYTITATGLGGTAMASATVTIINSKPVARAGADQTVVAGDTISLDGRGSSDVDEDSLSYQWSVVTMPDGSGAALSDPSVVDPTFVTSVSGTYELQLIVSDGTADSDPDTVTITATPQMIEVPGVSGLLQADAEAAIFSANLTVGTITAMNSETVPKGCIISQDPATGIPIEQGSAVALVVSLGTASTIPTISLSATPEVIQFGDSATLTWNSTDADAGFIEPEIGPVTVNGHTTVLPTHTTTYTITVTGPSGSASARATVSVLGNPDPQPEGSFGKQYEDLIPPNATVESYDSKRFSLITGLIQDETDVPIADVAVTVHGHPEYGTVSTDADGRFSMPVEGGETMTVTYQKAGLLILHRKVFVPWNDIATAEAVQMIAQDQISTTVTFDGNPETVVTHQSTEVTDVFGDRSCSMVFTGDNRAYLVDENGDDIHELTTITTRATEYTTPESMPAVLPPASAYTYCVEMSIDGAKRVRFEKPVITWIENFLGFDVGEIVPVGYYDRDRGVWVPSGNGVVAKLLDTNSDGIVDALDADGDDLPDDLDTDGLLGDEVEGLGDAGRYPPGSTFWRVTVTHFTPWDCNWPYGPPADAAPPNPEGVPDSDQQMEEEKDCKGYNNSFVEERSRIFHEDLPVLGTGITLHYASNRVEGYKSVITVPASGDTVPASLKSIIVRVEVAGRVFEQILDPLPNQKEYVVWDGLDPLGRKVSGSTTAHIGVGFVYDGVYYGAGNFTRAFAQAGGDVTAIRARQEMISWKRYETVIHAGMAKGQGSIAEGWTISTHHSLSPMDPSTLHKGDGDIVKNNSIIIATVAGNGIYGYSGDGGPATEAQLNDPSAVAVDSLGNLYITDEGNWRVRKVDTTGTITTLATIRWAHDVAVDASGNLYIAEWGNNRIRKVDTSGIITLVVGNGSQGYSGDGGPAIEAQLYKPTGVAVDAAGILYIADARNHRIRKVDTSGIITTVAGTGVEGSSGDGGPATEAMLSYPYRVAVDAQGNIYIPQNSYHIIRKVDTSGIITTVAGNGSNGYSGDGSPATEAQLNYPTDVAVDSSGSLYIAEGYNNLVRKVDTSGIITTVAGDGTNGYSGDGGPPTQARLRYPLGVAVDASGNLFIADELNHRIRKVAPPSAFAAYTTSGDISFVEKGGLGHILSSAGLHETTIDLDTGVILREFSYDEDNNLVSVVDRFGNQTTVERDANGVPNSITSPDGITTTLTIDSNNHLTKITFPDGSYYSFEYTSDGLLTDKIEPEGNCFNHAFDSLGRLTNATDEEGGSWQYSRTAYENGDILTEVLTGEGNLTSYLDHTYSTGAYTSTITGPTGAQTLLGQSSDGLTVTKSLSCGMDLDFKYDVDPEYKFKYVKEMTEKAPSLLEKVTLRDKTYEDTNSDGIPDLITETLTVNGKASTLVNNVLQAQRTISSPVGRTVTTHHDPATLLTSSLSIPGLHDTTYGYDTRGRLTSIITDTRETSFAYNAKGFLDSVTDPENHTTSYTYDAVGRTTGIDQPDGSSVGFTYDGNGNMIVRTNPSSIDHGFGYNAVNSNSSYQTPLSGSYTYVYDKDRRLVQTNFPSGNQINNIYANGRLEQIQTPGGNIDLTYLCSTKIDSITKGTESITYGYDGKLVTSEALSGTLSQALSYGYNNDFNLTRFTYSGGTESYTYDNDGLLTGAGSFTIGRNAGNGLPESVSGGALSLARIFNGYGEVEGQDFAVNGNSLSDWNLSRNDNGRITAKAETVDGVTSNYVYTYDSMGRLLTVTKDGSLVEEYQYGLNGARTYEMNSLRGIAGRTFDYSDEDHLLTAGTTTYQYNVDGFLTTKSDGTDVTSYDYLPRGELLGVTLPDGTVVEYVHDPLGRRIAKTVSGVTTEKYLWQGLTRLLAVYDGSDNLVMRFQYADGRMPVAMTQSGSTYYLTYDQVGSLRVVAEASGNVVKEIGYDAFGNVVLDTNPSFPVPFGFAGGLHDRDTALVRFGYRDYDPDVGRWTAKDPILFADGDTDLYGYCLNDPVGFYDPLGLIHWGAVGKGGFAVISGGVSTYVGAGVSTTIVGAIGGVPMVVGGAAAVGWGVSQITAGLLDNQIDVPKPSVASLGALLVTADVDRACQADLIEDTLFLGANVGSFAAKVPSTLELLDVGAGLADIFLASQSK
jgi:RHS repeat-associated protein